MTRRRLLITFVIFTFSAGVAFALQNMIYEMVIVPLTYLWWVIKLYYRLVPQVFVWAALIFAVLFTAVRALLMQIPLRSEIKKTWKNSQGSIETLSALLRKQKRGVYYKWLIANRLGKLAREALDQREGQRAGARFTRLAGRDWNPPREVEAYLEIGLNGSFADYPQRRWSRPPSTPLDEHPQCVVEYLESEMETHSNGDR